MVDSKQGGRSLAVYDANIERGRNATRDSIKTVRKALRDRGVNLSFGNDQAIAAISFIDRDADGEE